LYGPTDPARNGPYHLTSRSAAVIGAPAYFGDDIVLRSENAVRTHARNDQTDPSMLAIDVPSVFAAVRRRIGAAA
jgi:hypothetical protein